MQSPNALRRITGRVTITHVLATPEWLCTLLAQNLKEKNYPALKELVCVVHHGPKFIIDLFRIRPCANGST